jgi:ABC-type sugar transport system permease subunit
MTKLHRTGFFVNLSGVILGFVGFWIAGTMGVVEFSSQYFWTFVIFPLVIAAVVTGLSWKWSIVGGSVGVVTPLALFFIIEMEALYRYLFIAVILLYFAGGVLLLLNAIKMRRVNI